eukprot:13417011-Alexandrium_andersonii.AAC.1
MASPCPASVPPARGARICPCPASSASGASASAGGRSGPYSCASRTGSKTGYGCTAFGSETV